MSEVVDLTAFGGGDVPPAAVAPRVAVAAAAVSTIVLLDDDSDEDSIDRRRNRRKRRRQNHSSPASEVTVVETQQVTPRAELVVLEVFPDCALTYIQTVLPQHGGNPEAVIAHLLENKDYPKAKVAMDAPLVRVEQRWKYDYMSQSSFTSSGLYLHQATDQLLADFPFLNKKGASCALLKFGRHYAIAHDRILSAVKGSKVRQGDDELETSQYHRVVDALAGKQLDGSQSAAMKEIVGTSAGSLAKRPRKSCQSALVTEATLLEEVQYVKDKLKAWLETNRQRSDRVLHKKKAVDEGVAVECSCCFDQFDIGDMVACREEGHVFCVDCLKAFVENLVFGKGNLGIDDKSKQPNLEVKCFHGDGCSSGFDRLLLEKALPPKTLEKYDEVQFQATIQRAGLSDIFSCPKCGYQASLPASQKIFCCPVAGCVFESCKDCGEASHIPLRCDEVEKERETKGRLTVEEAISAAKIRKCPNPKCGKSFIKSDGCNKMRCSCGTLVCYVCRQRIRDYSHFCQTAHCDHKTCGKCRLYTNAEQDDALAMKEAGLKAASEVKAGTGAECGAAGSVDIDVDSILKEPAKRR